VGTAHYTGVLDTETITVDLVAKERAFAKIDLGAGLATSPNIHVGRKSGSTVFVQSSTGEITRIEEENPLSKPVKYKIRYAVLEISTIVFFA